jgi:teichuronic acid biosynthesis glycosyltransferase TuaG
MHSNQTNIKISVIIPVYNGAEYIEQCLNSIKNQNCNTEIIIINDASTDNLEIVLENIKKKLSIDFIYIKNEHRLGTADTRNKGIERASGDYIAFLDADDWWEDNKLKKQLELIKNGAYFIYTGRKNIYTNTNEEKIINVPKKANLIDILKNNPITCSSVLVRSDIIKSHLMEHPELCEDYYTWIKILKDYEYADGINEPLVNYRVRVNSESSNKIKHAIKRYKTYKCAKIPLHKRIYYSIYYGFAGVFKYYLNRKNKEEEHD